MDHTVTLKELAARAPNFREILTALEYEGYERLQNLVEDPNWTAKLERDGWGTHSIKSLCNWLRRSRAIPMMFTAEAGAVEKVPDHQADELARYLATLPGDPEINLGTYLLRIKPYPEYAIRDRVRITVAWRDHLQKHLDEELRAHDITLSRRAKDALSNAQYNLGQGYRLPRHLVADPRFTLELLGQQKNCGKRTIAEIRDAFAALGYTIKPK